MKSRNYWYKKFSCSISYIIGIVLINKAFFFAPCFTINNCVVSSVDPLVGIVYVLRDFAQQEIKHYVIFAMLLGCAISYFLAEKSVALASVSAFFIGELLDWIIFSLSKKPLSQRLLWSSCLTVPIDSVIFLYLMNMLNFPGFIVFSSGKMLGVFGIWYLWRKKNQLVAQQIQQ